MNDQKDGAEPADTADARERVQQLVAELIDGTELHVQELANGLVITNSRDLERGQVHMAFADGYVCLERTVWEYWGTIAGFESGLSTKRYPRDDGTGEAVVSGERVVDALTSVDSRSTNVMD